MLTGHLHLFLCEVSVKATFELLVFLLNGTDPLLVCALDASPLPDMCFVKIFPSLSVACLFILLQIYFDVFIFVETQFIVGCYFFLWAFMVFKSV